MGSGSGSRVGKPAGIGKDLHGAITLTRRNEGQVTPKYSTGRGSTSSQVALQGKKKRFFHPGFQSGERTRAAALGNCQELHLREIFCSTPEPEIPQLCFCRGRKGGRRYGLVLW